MTLYRNATDSIPLTIILLTDFPVFNTTGLAEIRLVALESDFSTALGRGEEFNAKAKTPRRKKTDERLSAVGATSL